MKKIAEHTDQTWYSVESVKDIRRSSKGIELLIGWKGYTSASDTWEPLHVMYEDVPNIVESFLKSKSRNPSAKRALRSLNL